MLALTSDIAAGTAKMTWKVLRKINSLLPEGDLPSPSWAPGRLLKQRERTPMAVGVPRRTQSLCPDCNRDTATGFSWELRQPLECVPAASEGGQGPSLDWANPLPATSC